MNKFLAFWKNGWKDFAKSFFTFKFFWVAFVSIPFSIALSLLLGASWQLSLAIACFTTILLQLFSSSKSSRPLYDFAKSFKKDQ